LAFGFENMKKLWSKVKIFCELTLLEGCGKKIYPTMRKGIMKPQKTSAWSEIPVSEKVALTEANTVSVTLSMSVEDHWEISVVGRCWCEWKKGHVSCKLSMWRRSSKDASCQEVLKEAKIQRPRQTDEDHQRAHHSDEK
jgi:hypothetical protein